MSTDKPLKPYVVTIEFTAIVMAKGELHAIEVANSHKHDICSDEDGDFSSGHEITSEDALSAYGWDGMCLPYGGDGRTRLKDIIAALEALPARDTKTIDMFQEQQS